MDNGFVGFENSRTQKCPPSIKIFDLITNVLLKKYELKPEDLREVSAL